jgi:hypothetical protein
MKLLITLDGTTTEYEPRPDLGVISVGRAEGNDVCIPTASISRKHLTIERTVDGWKLVDQMSANGTKVNEETVNFAFLKEGDVITIGAATLRVTGLAPAPAPAAPPVRKAPAKRAKVKSPPAAAPAAPQPVQGRPAPRNAAAYSTPRKGSPAGIAIGTGFIVLVLVVGGWFAIRGGGGAVPDTGETTAQRPTQTRTAELEEAEQRQLSRIYRVAASNAPLDKRLEELDEIRSELGGRRGTVAAGELENLRADLMEQLKTEIDDRVADALDSANEYQLQGNYASAINKLDDTLAWVQSGTYVRAFGGSFASVISQELDAARQANLGFIGGTYNEMWHLAEQLQFDEAIALAEELLERAWWEGDNRSVYERELESLKAQRELHLRTPEVQPQPEEEEPAPEDPSPEPVVEEPGREPGPSDLLPDGERSEQVLLAALHAKLVHAAADRTLSSLEFEWRGNRANIVSADDDGLRVQVFSRDRNTNEELPPYQTSVRWERFSAEDLLQLYDRTPDLTSEDRFALAILAYDAGLFDEGSRRALAVYRLEPDWKPAIDSLIAQKRRMRIPDGGFIEFEGMLIAPDEQEDILFRRRLDSVLQRFQRGIGSRERRLREDSEAAFEELVELGERAVQPAIVVLQGVLTREIKAAEDAAGLSSADDRVMEQLLSELERRREHALSLIMDPVAYPYPYGPNRAEIQADVNERVAAVREIWDDPTSFIGRTNPNYQENINRVRAVAERMARLDPENRYHERTPDETIEYLRMQANNRLTIREWPGANRRYQSLINYNRQVMEFNENFPTGAAHADGDSRLQVRITNEYRMMFGRHALKINDKLFWASWVHSRYCSVHRGGQIAHVIPGHPYGDGPQDRAVRQGYVHGVGENMHMNSGGPTAMGAHTGWVNSSGHHRNLLAPQWRVLGSAKFGQVWTQKFGEVDEGNDNASSNGPID